MNSRALKRNIERQFSKLADPEKSMILSQFDRAASAPCPDLEHILETSRAQDRGGKMAQKGDFAGAGSFESCLLNQEFSLEQVSRGPAHQAYLLLKTAFVLIPIIAGLDKFFHLLVDWNKYLLMEFGVWGPKLMLLAGVVEIGAGLGVLFRPKIFSYIVALWLAWIIANLIHLGGFYDIVLRDFGLFLSALAFARLAKVYG